MEIKLTQHSVETWLETVVPNKLFHFKETLFGQVSPESYGSLRTIYSRLSKERKVRASGLRDGYYYKIEQIKPIRSLDGGGGDYLDLVFPRSHSGDNSIFGFEDLIAVSPGDVILVTGVSNSGKTCFVLNLLAENIKLLEGSVLMGNEYVTADRVITPRFRRRLKRMSWSELVNGQNQLQFDLLPVKANFENYIQKDKLNIVDWINMPNSFFEIAQIHEGIKEGVGKGLAVVVMQKTRGKEYADGGEFSERLVDAYIKIDPFGDWQSVLTLGKVKESKGRTTGRSWAFAIVEGGTSLHNIREVVRCSTCWGRGYTKIGRCSSCEGRKYIEKA